MRATIISMVMRLPGSLPGTSVAGGLRSARERGAVSGLGARCVSGQDCARPGLRRGLGLGRAQHTDASFSAPGDTRFASRDAASIPGVRGSGEGFQAMFDGLGHHGDLPLGDSVRPRLAPPS